MNLFNRLDYFFDRIYSWRYNPLYQSGVLTIFLLLVVITTGTYLVFFYKVGLPYESVENIQHQILAGRWIRSLHRYAADAAVVAATYHMLRMFVQRRVWGTRTLAWISGLILLGTLFFSGLTGLMLVWDVHGKMLATELARLLDVFPVFSEPILMAFEGSDPLPRSFFFLTLFIHVSMPLGLAFLLWLHTSKVARPVLLPPRKLMGGTLAVLFILAIILTVPLAPKADPYLLTSQFPFNAFYTFWLPVSIKLSPSIDVITFILFNVFLFSIPWIFRPPLEQKLPPSFVHEKSCTGCTSCYNDCPFDAIAMVPRMVGVGSELVANVNPLLCVSCGICAAACDPMGVGPSGRTGRDQIKDLEHIFADRIRLKETVLVLGCEQSIAWPESVMKNQRFIFHTVHCAGGMHTAAMEYALKRGVCGIFIVSCPPRNCLNREGPKWLLARLYEGHESALNPQVDRDLIQVAHLGSMEVFRACDELNSFSERLKVKAKLDLSQLPEKECAMEGLE